MRLAAMVVAISFAGALRAQDSGKDFKKFISMIEPEEVAAIEHKDSSFFEKLYSPDFQSKDEHGVTNGKKVALYLLRYHFNTLQNLRFQAKILSVATSGKVGMVTLKTTLNAVTAGRQGAKGSPVELTRIEKRKFVKQGSHWLMSLDQDIKKPMLLAPAQPTAPMGLAPAHKN